MKGFQAVYMVLVLMSIGCATNSLATTIMFTDRSSWQSAVNALEYGSTNINFDNAVNTNNTSTWTVTAGDVQFSTQDTYVVASSSGSTFYGTGNALDFLPTSLQVSLPSQSYAFGFDLGAGFYTPSEYFTPPYLASLWDVVLSNGDLLPGVYNADPSSLAFFGFLSDDSISSLTMFAGAWPDTLIDNFTYAQSAAPVPEPATLLLLGSGLIGFVVSRKRSRN